MLPFKGMVKTRGKKLGANQEFSFNYIPTEMPIIHPRGAMDKQVAGYLSWELRGWVGAELINLEAIMVGARGGCDFSRATWRVPSITQSSEGVVGLPLLL